MMEDDFLDAEANRDPFRSFAEQFAVKGPSTPQRTVLLPNTSVEEMRLIAIVTRISPARVMLTDGTGVGHVVHRGDYVGRGETVQAGGPDGVPVTLNWRVDRILPNELVLVREDPTAPDKPPLTRRLMLHEAGEEQKKTG